MRKKISIVIPFYNEEENLQKIYDEINVLRLRESQYDFEILLMDNHSRDNSYPVAVGLAVKDPTVRVIRLSRNFGFQSNILTGFLNCSGDAAVQLDADGEDDPLIISEFLRRWEEGYKVVYGIRKHREENFAITFLRKCFYKLIASLSTVPLPVDSGDFRLVDRQILDILPNFKETSLYLRGILSYIGFEQFGIPYKRRSRYRGVSKFGILDYFTLAIDGITSFSRKPLTLVAQLGLLLSLLSFVAMMFYIALYFTVGVEVRGFTTLVILQLMMTGIQLLCLGINGMYVGRIFDEVKARPRSLIQEYYPPQGATKE